MKKAFLSTIIACFAFSMTYAQGNVDSQEPKPFKHALGTSIGSTIGVGLTYRFTANKFKIQTAFLPVKTENGSDYYTGLTFMYNLVSTSKTNLFLYQGNRFRSKTREVTKVDEFNNKNTEDVTTNYLNTGLGVGIEFIIAQRVGLNFMGGYAGYDSFRTIGPAGEVSLLYNF